MAGERSSYPSEPYLPRNTIVVLPRPLPMNRGAFWVLFWTIGLLMGLFIRTIIEDTGSLHRATAAGTGNTTSVDLAAIAEPATMEVHIRAVLEMPTATPTSPPRPTMTVSPDPASGQDFCSNTDPGKLCRVPYPTPPPPTPFPSCADMDKLAPGDWCVWPTQSSGYANRD